MSFMWNMPIFFTSFGRSLVFIHCKWWNFPKKNVRTAFYSLIYFRFFGVRACSTRSTVCNRDHIILNILLKCMLENILMREKGEQPLVFSENNNTQTHSMSHKECVSQRILWAIDPEKCGFSQHRSNKGTIISLDDVN